MKKTSLVFGQSTTVEALPFIYEIKKQLNTKVSLSKKIHIINLPHWTPLNAVWSEPISWAIPLKPPGKLSRLLSDI
jgi:hypothetical protein